MGLFDKIRNQKKESDLCLIVGLGNPGKEYEQTKHNVGFLVIDRLAKKYDITVTKFQHKALVGNGEIAGRKVMLVKPQTFMNLSGESVRDIVNFYKVPQERFVVIYDDTSLPAGQIRLREKGSHGGHNGIRNIIQLMGTDVFGRIKVGIGEKPNGWDLADYVLAKFDADTMPLMESGMEKAVEAVEWILRRGMSEAMNRMNQRPKAPKVKQQPQAVQAPAEIKKEVEA